MYSYSNIILITTAILLFTCLLVNFSLNSPYENNVQKTQLIPATQQCKAAVVCLQKDEDDILDLWLRYHSALFRPDCIVVLDNYSIKPETISVLSKWKAKGVRVVKECGPYLAKGSLTYKAFDAFKDVAKLAIPVDIDEFLTAYNESGPIFDYSATVAVALQHFYSSNDSGWGLQNYYTNKIVSSDDFSMTSYLSKSIYSNTTCKKIFKLDALTNLDHGNHGGVLRYGEIRTVSELGFVHFHYRGVKRVVARAINDCIGFGWLNASTTLETLNDSLAQLKTVPPNAMGRHKVAQLLGYLQGDKMIQPRLDTDILVNLTAVVEKIERQAHQSPYVLKD